MGQATIVNVLRNTVMRNQYRGCYLLSGPYGGGKTSLARIFAMATFCENSDQGEPCGTCQSCSDILNDKSSNYFEMDGAISGKVDEIRRIKEESHYKGFNGRNRIITIDECHMLTLQAQNALLKLFEDGSNFTFILCTTHPQDLLDTIISRSIQLNIRPVSDEDIVERLANVCKLENISYEEKALYRIVAYAGSHIRDSLMAVDKISISGEVTLENVIDILGLADDDLFYKILIGLKRNVPESFSLLRDLFNRISAKDIYDGLIAAALETTKLSRRIPSHDYVNRDLVRKLYDTYGDDCVNIAKFLLRRPITNVSRAHVECDLLLIDKVLQDDIDLWSLVQQGIVKKLPPKPGANLENLTDMTFGSDMERRMMLGHKKIKLEKKGAIVEISPIEEQFVTNEEAYNILLDNGWVPREEIERSSSHQWR